MLAREGKDIGGIALAMRATIELAREVAKTVQHLGDDEKDGVKGLAMVVVRTAYLRAVDDFGDLLLKEEGLGSPQMRGAYYRYVQAWKAEVCSTGFGQGKRVPEEPTVDLRREEVKSAPAAPSPAPTPPTPSLFEQEAKPMRKKGELASVLCEP